MFVSTRIMRASNSRLEREKTEKKEEEPSLSLITNSKT
jgi:hypothetical protein